MSVKEPIKVATIVADAGGTLVGRTRLQKIAYLLTAAGLEDGFSFAYKHYGPYSDALANAARAGHLLGYIRESECAASWGGSYSIFERGNIDLPASSDARRRLTQIAAAADAVELELAATALFLAKQGVTDPWQETSRRKPEKSASGRIERARHLLRQMSTISTPVPIPNIG